MAAAAETMVAVGGSCVQSVERAWRWTSRMWLRMGRVIAVVMRFAVSRHNEGGNVAICARSCVVRTIAKSSSVRTVARRSSALTSGPRWSTAR